MLVKITILDAVLHNVKKTEKHNNYCVKVLNLLQANMLVTIVNSMRNVKLFLNIQQSAVGVSVLGACRDRLPVRRSH